MMIQILYTVRAVGLREASKVTLKKDHMHACFFVLIFTVLK